MAKAGNSSGRRLWHKARNAVSAIGAFKSHYSKVDLTNGNPADMRPIMTKQPSPRRASKKGCIALSACILLVVVVIVATVVGVKVSNSTNGAGDGGDSSVISVAGICSRTLYPDVCNNTLTGTDTSDPRKYVQVAMKDALTAINRTMYVVDDLHLSSPEKNGTQYSTLEMCKEVISECLDQINTSLYRVSDLELNSVNTEVGDIQQYMSAALTYQDTCLTGVEEFGIWNGSDILNGTEGAYTTKLISNSLSLVNSLSKLTDLSNVLPRHFRRLLTQPTINVNTSSRLSTPDVLQKDSELGEQFPQWLSREGRRLLQTSRPTANAVVAQDGSGNYMTIQAAVNAAPQGSTQWVIYVKSGTYSETVTIPKGNKNLMMYGDGPGVTIITGNTSVALSGVSTFFTATFSVAASGFIGRDMTIRNTAGPQGMQAVALKAAGDQQAFANINIEGYQDTLYTLSLRQFYSGCTIYGTIDYIFGNAAAVFQNCNLMARPGAASSQNTYTASGRTDPGQSTGLSFLSCTVGPAPELPATYPTYLGRPWKPYAQTLFIESTLASCVNPAGWLLWNGDPNSGNTVYYGEYGNTGPGASTASRVTWSKQISPTDANKFTVSSFITGQQWLPATAIPFNAAL